MVLDLMLPGMSGYEVIERLRAQPDLSDLPILVLSALGSASARVRGLREGADDYMTKPFLPEEIVARARTLVTRRLLARRTAELEALSRIAQAALTAPSPELLLFRLVEIVIEVFSADVAVIYMLDEARAELRPRAAVGLPPGVEPAPIPVGVGAVATAMSTREPVLISDGAAGVVAFGGRQRGEDRPRIAGAREQQHLALERRPAHLRGQRGHVLSAGQEVGPAHAHERFATADHLVEGAVREDDPIIAVGNDHAFADAPNDVGQLARLVLEAGVLDGDGCTVGDDAQQPIGPASQPPRAARHLEHADR